MMFPDMDLPMILALLAMAAAQAADIVTTRAAMRRGAHEANPVVAWVMARFGRGWVWVKLALAAAGTGLLAWQGLWPAILVLAAAVAAVALHNRRQGR